MKRFVAVLVFSALVVQFPLWSDDKNTKVGATERLKQLAQAFSKSYPPSIHNNYRLFMAKCIGCHSVEVAFDVKASLPSELNSMIVRMAGMEGANISSSDIKQIEEFMIYDAAVRNRKRLLDELKALPPAQQETEKEAIKRVVQKYKK